MTSSVFDHAWLSGLFAAPQIAPFWTEAEQLKHLLAFETAFTNALHSAGRINDADAAAALDAIAGFVPDFDALREGTLQNGLVIPTLITQLRTGLTAPNAIHSGATSQDVLDTALTLTLKGVAEILCAELTAINAELGQLKNRFGTNEMMGRTRMQAALPITVADRVLAWQRPLENHLRQMAALGPDVFALQLGGPVGNNADLGANAGNISQHIGKALGLSVPDAAWHTDRSRIVAFGNWLTLIAGSLGKIGQDMSLMTQQGINDATLSGGGTSSAMAHKNNPISAELLVTLARFTAGQSGILSQTLVHEQERSGAAWALEWMVLPQMTMATGCATQTALRLLKTIQTMGHSSAAGTHD